MQQLGSHGNAYSKTLKYQKHVSVIEVRKIDLSFDLNITIPPPPSDIEGKDGGEVPIHKEHVTI